MSRSMIKQQNSGATAHVVLYTPRQSTNVVYNSTCITTVVEWLKTMDILNIVAVVGRASATPARSAVFDCCIYLHIHNHIYRLSPMTHNHMEYWKLYYCTSGP